MSYLRYLTLSTFRKHNPDWTMILHTPRVPSCAAPTWPGHEQTEHYHGPDHVTLVGDLDVHIKTHTFAKIGFSDQAHEVHKSDRLRWYLLHAHGGLWSDMDIVYVRGMHSLLENTPRSHDLDVALVPLIGSKKHTVGFLLSSPGNSFIRLMSESSALRFNQDHYQCMGSDLLNAFPDLNHMQQAAPGTVIQFLDKKCVYRINSKKIPIFSQPHEQTQEPLHQRRTVGFHWYGGHPLSTNLERQITKENLHQHDHTLAAIIRTALS